MNFFQVFGVDVIVLGIYILGMVLEWIWVSSMGDEDDDPALLFAIYGAAAFVCMFTAWYMGVPVPTWMK